MGLALLLEPNGAALHEPRPTALGKADVDDIEVPRNDRLAERGPRFPQDLRSEVAVGEVGQDEHPHVAGEGELRHRRRGRMQRLVRSLALLDGEGRLVDEDVGAARSLEHRAPWAPVAGQDDLAAGPRRSQDLFRRNPAATGELDLLAVLEAPEERALRNPERSSSVDVETAGSRLLYERVAHGGDTVVDFEGRDPVVTAVKRVARA